MVSVKRFRVALSFPGEYRGRVAEVAGALGAALGREKILYDRWWAPEFARPNLDVYLSGLYRDESDLIAIFLCKQYDEKQWCGLEWRACRDLLKQKQDARLMFLRLDNADIPGLYSIDGYLDISQMLDKDVAAAILQRLGGEDRPAAQPVSQSHRAFTSKLPTVNPLLIGRDQQIAFLDRAWDDPKTHVVQVIAAGGTGKTALMDKWFRRHLGEADFFGWSFDNQGSGGAPETSSDPFFADLIRWFQIDVAPRDSVYIKAEAVARHMRSERALLWLDGVESMQEPSGALRDVALKALLQELATGQRGLVVCTTRVRMDIPDSTALDLDNLTAAQGGEYLRALKVTGTDDELRQASQEYWNNALALTLLGAYLVDFCGGDIRRRVEIAELMVDEAEHGADARRVIAAYAEMFAAKPELDILRALGYFNRPAEPEALALVRPAIEDRKYQAALNRIYAARLILTKDPTQPLDCHPLVREFFAADATADGHARLYEYYAQQTPKWPDTLESMTPLLYAVYHGCHAGRQQAALDDIYRDRIDRGPEAYLTKKLGAFGTNLALLANFFEVPWTRPAATLSEPAQSWLLSAAGFSLRAVGRLSDAVGPVTAGAKTAAAANSKDASVAYSDLAELHLTLGNISEAIAAAQQAVSFADGSGAWSARSFSRASLATALHQAGNVADAPGLFTESEKIQAQNQPGYSVLYSVRGYRYCDLLLDQGQTAEVIRRASQTLNWEQGRLLDIGLDHVSLGRAYPRDSAEASGHLDQAVEFLRRAGTIHHLPRGLLARATLQDLDEVFRIATRSGMRLFLTDYHLACGNLAEAEALIQATGYHRRDRELAELRARIAKP